ncbi:hypothetical protein CRG98_008817 [Punica granatum]|uniref:DDE Tnp4 domain-containing protein n=1 Tax=Punica granatum TaxID=22663 RepID=A0A2I0KQN8_PUNGR|nr:hypothetical protein CRG98_008817 [Punica granatum]
MVATASSHPCQKLGVYCDDRCSDLDCGVVAVDEDPKGIHVAVTPQEYIQGQYHDDKSVPTQNVMYVCSHDMMFSYVKTGWEGSAHDARILMDTVAGPEFLTPPPRKYNVVDAGYPKMMGFLALYKGENYHPSHFRGCHVRTRKELFNKRHSSVRNVIERCFGVLKNKFTLLRLMPNISVYKQADIVLSCFVLHNFIKIEEHFDCLFKEYGDNCYYVGDELP